jgi:hypothetical protein
MKTGPDVGATTREGQASGAEGTIPRAGRRGALLPIRIEDAHRFAALTRSGARKASEIVLLILRTLQPSRCAQKEEASEAMVELQGRCRSRARQNGTAKSAAAGQRGGEKNMRLLRKNPAG